MPATATVTDAAGRYSSDQKAQIVANAVAAFAMWQPFLGDSPASIEINVVVATTADRANGSSTAVSQVGTSGGLTLYTQGAAFELLTGTDPNGAVADITITLNPDFQTQYYWIDPLNGASKPTNQSDLIDVFAHEIGHALGFIGWRDWGTYQLPSGANYQGVFDALVTVVGGAPFFNGPNAMAVYGGPVPLTEGNIFHLGNTAPKAGSALLSDIMNGVTFNFARYKISTLDVAILSDLGVPTVLNDVLKGSAAGDAIYAGAGDDAVTGAGGADLIDGGSGRDTAVYGGPSTNYSWSLNPDGGWTVRDNRSGAPDGIDTLRNVEVLSFTDRTVVLVAAGFSVETLFQNILRTSATWPATLALAASLDAQINSGALSSSAAIQKVAAQAGATTSVATLAYEFFTGKIPGQGGVDYLVSPTGPNANNLNSAYYQSFNLENRYINFAVNLGKAGEGAAAFSANYGGKTLIEATRDAYRTIFGVAPSDAKIHALIDTRVDYFAAYGQDGANGIGTKAALVGWLLAEAVKADVGMYAKANDAFLIDLADGASFAVDIVGVYGKAEFSVF